MKKNSFINFSILALIISCAAFSAESVSSLKDVATYPNKLVKVSSEFYDFDRKQTVRIYGVGTVIALNPRLAELEKVAYFILTTGHVANGHSLRVENAQGEIWPFRRIIHRDTADLTLIELDIDLMVQVPPAMAYFEIIGNQNIGMLNTLFNQTSEVKFREHSRNYFLLKNSLYNEVYPAMTIDGDRNSAFVNGQWQAELLLPWWLPVPVGKNNQDGKNWDYAISQDKNIDHFTSEQNFSRGYSGSPVVIRREWSLTLGQQYVISGILISSSYNGGSSQFAGPNEINSLLKCAIGNRTLIQLSEGLCTQKFLYWGQINGNFFKFDNDNKLTVYKKNGPVGNAVGISGHPTLPENGPIEDVMNLILESDIKN